MKAFTCGFILVISIFSASFAKDGDPWPNECYVDANTIRNWIDGPPGWPKGSWYPEGSSFIEKAIYRSGDGIALGIIHAYPLQDLLDPGRLDRILSIMKLSFSQPEFIVRHEDSRPAVTTLLLFALEYGCKETQLKEKIRDAERYISSQQTKHQANPKSK